MNLKILLVDDQQTVIAVEKMLLKELGVEFLVARNGKEALEQAKAHQPNLIVLDIMMPEMDGIEACQILKSDDDTKDIPVVMVTTKGNPEKVEAAFQAGCNDFITKPIKKVEFMEKIKMHLNGSK